MPKCWSNFRNGFSVFFSVNKFPLHRLNLNSKRARGTSPFREHGKSSASVVRCHVVSKFQLFYLTFKSTSWELPFGKSLPFFARQTLHWLQLLNSPVHYFYSFFFILHLRHSIAVKRERDLTVPKWVFFAFLTRLLIIEKPPIHWEWWSCASATRAFHLPIESSLKNGKQL